MLNVRTLIVDGEEIPVAASWSLTQDYERIDAVSRRRFLDGGLWQRRTYTPKLRTVISCNGITPPGLHDLDVDNPIQLACVASRGVNSISNVIVIPANRRADAGSEPFGYAQVGDNWIPTPVSMAGDTATLTIVSGASMYQCRYFPMLTVVAHPIEEDLARGSGHGWRLTAEEV